MVGDNNCCPCVLFLSLFLCDVLGRAGQPDAQLSERTLAPDSTSITLASLQPDTEYVVSLYPLFPRNSASPSTLNARTCKSHMMRRLPVFGGSPLDRSHSDSLCLHVFACFSASWGGAAAISQDGVRGQRAGAVERCEGREGLQFGLGSVYRSAGGQRCCSLFAYARFSFVGVFVTQKGVKVGTVELASDREAYTLSGLQPDTEYIVTVIPLYEGSAEGPVETARFKIGGLVFVVPADWAQSLSCCSLFEVHV